MTALDQFDRLEATAIWRRSERDTEQEVLVTFGNATLTLSALDQAGDRPVAHWSLGAVRRRSAIGDAVVFSPDDQASETLTVEDPLLIDALERVLRDRIKGTQIRGRRSKFKWMVGSLAACAAIYLLAPAMAVNVATRLISPERAELLAGEMITLIEGRTGPECRNGAANSALETIASKISPERKFAVHVLDLGDNLTVPLPGHILLDRELLERTATPEELAGWIGYAIVDSEKSAATRNLFDGSSMGDIIRFLSDGTVTPDAKNRAVNSLMLGDLQFDNEAIPTVTSILSVASIKTTDWSAGLQREGINATIRSENNLDVEPLMGEPGWLAVKNVCSG